MLVTTPAPSIGFNGYVKFKEPFQGWLVGTLGCDPSKLKLKVTSVIDMADMIVNDQRDPFTNIYFPLNIEESRYKEDLDSGVPVISFAYIDPLGVKGNFRVPHNYIESFSLTAQVPYQNCTIVIDLGKLPVALETDIVRAEIAELLLDRMGVLAELKEVRIGSPDLVGEDEHATRERIRQNTASVKKSVFSQLAETQNLYNELMRR